MIGRRIELKGWEVLCECECFTCCLLFNHFDEKRVIVEIWMSKQTLPELILGLQALMVSTIVPGCVFF
jgi:hypothetical protein